MPNIKDIITEKLHLLFPDIETWVREDITQVCKSSNIKNIDALTQPFKLYDNFTNYAINFFTTLQAFNKITESDIDNVLNYFQEYGYYTIALYGTEEETNVFYNKYQDYFKTLNDNISCHLEKCKAVLGITGEDKEEDKPAEFAMFNYIKSYLDDITKEESEHPSYIELLKKVATLEHALNERNKTPKFISMLNGTATNTLASISTRSTPPKIDQVSNTGIIEKGSLKVFIESFNEVTGELRTSTHKLLDACIIYLTQQNHYRGKDENINPEVVIPLTTYMELCGIPNTKASKDKTRRKVKEDLDTLYHISIEWTEPSGKNLRDFAKRRICSSVGIVKGNIVFSFSPEMAKYLTNSYLMQYPIELLKIDERNSNAYHIGKKLLLHNSIDNNKRKGTSNIIKVDNLLEICPNIPTYEEVMAGNRHIDQRIITPFENALNSLDFITWEYCNAKGEKSTQQQLEATSFTTFKNLYVRFEVEGVPDQTARLEARTEEAKKKAENKKTPARNKKQS